MVDELNLSSVNFNWKFEHPSSVRDIQSEIVKRPGKIPTLNVPRTASDLLNGIITVDKSWRQSQWKNPCSLQLKKATQIRSNVKTVVEFFNSTDILHWKYAPREQTANQKYYENTI